MNTPLNPGFYSKISCLAGSTSLFPGPSGSLINQDRLQGYPANYFLSKIEFPVDLTGVLVNHILKYDGEKFITSTLPSTPSTLTYFEESLTTKSVVFEALEGVDYFLKNIINTNFVFGPIEGLLNGLRNFVYCTDDKGQTITGDDNISIGNVSFTIGDKNTLLNSPIVVYGDQNFCVDQTHPIGNGVGNESNKNFIVSTSFVNSYTGIESILLYNTNLNISNSINNVLIKTTALEISTIANTAINLHNSVINGTNTFGSGRYLNLLSDYVVGFGQYALIEGASPHTRMSFFIGNGSDTSQRGNALTVWRSGATIIGGALKIGSSTGTSTSITEGMIRENNGYLQMYRSGQWSNQLSLFNPSLTDQSTLDGYDSSAFILKVEFPFTLTNPTENDVLVYVNSQFVNKPMSYLTNVGNQDTVDNLHASAFVQKTEFPLSSTTPTNQQILQFVNSTGLWTPVNLPTITAITPNWDIVGFDPSGIDLPTTNSITQGVVYVYNNAAYRVRPGSRTTDQSNNQVSIDAGKITFRQQGLYNINVCVTFSTSFARTDRPILLVLADITDQNNVIRVMEQIQNPCELNNLSEFPSALYFVSFSFSTSRVVQESDILALYVYCPDTSESGTISLTPMSTATKISIDEVTYQIV